MVSSPPGTASELPEWATPAPTRPSLRVGELHVWRADLTRIETRVTRSLSALELERAAGAGQARRRELWARSRGLLREMLAAYLSLEPAEVSLLSGPQGKPRLPGGERRDGAPALRFNLSHSRGLALYAFSTTCEVGIDLEAQPRSGEHVALSRRVLGEQEAGRLAAMDPAERGREFLCAWTLHEAAVKCRGSGLGGTAGEAGERPWSMQLELGGVAAAAVATERPPLQIRLWQRTSWPTTSGRPYRTSGPPDR